jgi:hypothetical protein
MVRSRSIDLTVKGSLPYGQLAEFYIVVAAATMQENKNFRSQHTYAAVNDSHGCYLRRCISTTA